MLTIKSNLLTPFIFVTWGYIKRWILLDQIIIVKSIKDFNHQVAKMKGLKNYSLCREISYNVGL